MWWITDNQVQRNSVGVFGGGTVSGSVRRTSVRSVVQHKRLKLPVSVAQASANLVLQESGVSGQAEAPMLRKDIRCLESALRNEETQKREACETLELLRAVHAGQIERFAALEAERSFLSGIRRHEYTRTAERSRWLRLAVDHGQTLTRTLLESPHANQPQIDSLMSRVSELEADEQCLKAALERAGQEQRILSDIVTDMEACRENDSELHSQETESLRRHLDQAGQAGQAGQAETSQVQQLNLKIVSQATELRSLKKELSQERDQRNLSIDEDLKRNLCGSVESVQPTHEAVEFSRRLEVSLAAARTELDAAVHDLQYANAECERLQNECLELESQYDHEFTQAVHVAELHSLHASLLEEQISDLGCLEIDLRHEISQHVEVTQELRGKVAKLSNAMEDSNENQNTDSVMSHNLQLEVAELREDNEAIDVLQKDNAELAGANHKLTLINESLNEQFGAAELQAEESVLQHTKTVQDLQRVLEHHERVSAVAQAEVDLAVSQFDDKRSEFKKGLEQRDQVIQSLNADVGKYQARLKQLESELEGESVNRTIAEQESQRLSLEGSQRIAFMSSEREELQRELKRLQDDADGRDSSAIRSAA